MLTWSSLKSIQHQTTPKISQVGNAKYLGMLKRQNARKAYLEVKCELKSGWALRFLAYNTSGVAAVTVLGVTLHLWFHSTTLGNTISVPKALHASSMATAVFGWKCCFFCDRWCSSSTAFYFESTARGALSKAWLESSAVLVGRLPTGAKTWPNCRVEEEEGNFLMDPEGSE